MDAGKTTLSEAMLYFSGRLRRMGRVDNQDAFLDHYELERARGITIFSKQAVLTLGDMSVTLLDTPGHVDFSAETERTLRALDCAVLVINGADGVQGHTLTLWKLLKRYALPVFLFINKLDQPGTDRDALLSELREKLSEGCVSFARTDSEEFYESVAVEDEEALSQYLENGRVEKERLRKMIAGRALFPCYFGSALKGEGVRELLEGISGYACAPPFQEAFGARVFKIARDAQENRLTYLKLTGGRLAVRTELARYGEKVNELRVYSGERYETVPEAQAGMVVAATGLSVSRPGDGLGSEADAAPPVLAPVLTYRMLLPEGCAPVSFLPKLKQLEEEEPELHIIWEEELSQLKVRVMGQIQTEILKELIRRRFGVEVEFGAGSILYKETVKNTVEGIGHYEPLKHYAEVHLILEPAEAGSGLTFASACREDALDKSWQRLILTHLREKEHRGVLTGSPLTDMRITLAGGRAHKKHTEGGDFRQAAYRAVRQGLMQAESVLLEPFYEYRLEVPETAAGRAMADLNRMSATFGAPEMEKGAAVFYGSVPASEAAEYQKEVVAYTKGLGHFECSFFGYAPCHNAEAVIGERGYEADRDTDNPSFSIFCGHGAGFVVEWDRVEEFMHLERCLPAGPGEEDGERSVRSAADASDSEWIDPREVEAILKRTYYANEKGTEKARGWGQRRRAGDGEAIPSGTRVYRPKPRRDQYLLVDGYNVIFAWEDLKELAAVSLDGARGRLLDILCDYQAVRGCNLIVVFDAYRVQGHAAEALDYHNIHVVYTKEAETADNYIERFAHENRERYEVTVATSDGLEQVIIRGQGCGLLSSRELLEEIGRAKKELRERYSDGSGGFTFTG